ncbi:hypothetical protein J6590_013850, partial [Homalodisca vitripennis]
MKYLQVLSTGRLAHCVLLIEHARFCQPILLFFPTVFSRTPPSLLKEITPHSLSCETR